MLKSDEIKERFRIRFEVAISLATSSEPKYADLREELLTKICKEDPMIARMINDFRREFQ